MPNNTCEQNVNIQIFNCYQRSSMKYGRNKAQKTAILLVAFGTSYPEAQKAYDLMHKKTEEQFPGIHICWAYTSAFIRKKLARQGTICDSLPMALSRLIEEDFTHVAVQPLHTIPGHEFDDITRIVSAFRHIPKGLKQIALSYPLLLTEKDMEIVGNALLKIIPAKRKPDQAVIFVGHGSNHPANNFYPALAYWLQQKDPLLFMSTVEHWPDLELTRKQLKNQNPSKIFLLPFLAVAGDHARNDIAGYDQDSWKNVLENDGYVCQAVLKGIAEYEVFLEIWLDHLSSAMQALRPGKT